MKGLSDEYVASAIRKAVSGRLTTRHAAARLGASRQYVNRLKRAYSEGGAQALRHGNEGRSPAWKTGKATEEAVVAPCRGKYAGFNFSHFREKLLEEEGIEIGYASLHRILTEAGIRSPKGRGNGRKARPEHPSRPRRERFGELLQIDASIHRCFGPDLPGDPPRGHRRRHGDGDGALVRQGGDPRRVLRDGVADPGETRDPGGVLRG